LINNKISDNVVLGRMDSHNLIIQVGNIDKDFEVATEYIKVLHNITLTILEGEFIIITGPSGCGKSTLLHTISGWEEPTFGNVLLFGEDIYAKDEEERAIFCNKKMTMVSQKSYWVNSLNVLENIALPYLISGYNKKEASKKAMQLLNLLELEELAYYKPADLSGGQQQRINLLRALINNPDIVLADEPTGNLDSLNTTFVMDLFQKINKDLKRTVIVVTHNPNFLDFATRVIIMKDGRIADTILNEPNFVSTKPVGDILDLKKHGLKIEKKDWLK